MYPDKLDRAALIAELILMDIEPGREIGTVRIRFYPLKARPPYHVPVEWGAITTLDLYWAVQDARNAWGDDRGS